MFFVEVSDSSDQKNMQKVAVDKHELPDLEALHDVSQPKSKIRKIIERMEISADAKALLFSLNDKVVKIGKILLPVGRAILGAALELLKLFPTLSLALILSKFLPLLLPAWLVKIGVAGLISSFLTLLGLYLDTKDIFKEAIKGDSRFSAAAQKMAALFFPKEGVEHAT